ncbi:GIY-YIG nuclease family protein [Shewanella sp. C32]|uniref:GIY-YIG nuclease family protein n=1 Tax=Shewanella electrica TaxID=515560 RepID=A0ABT2FG67_9GAMM|nr:GIY-YIG nuclease family protein [Shewanella electrica]MCH1925103.1 GIY-YIG nuclease family protein [Shewanella electrica]MCS4554927.1 GIY-YIG nuclease family protein [Shewanella electrica]
MSFIYILNNKSFEPYVLKIGKTRISPEVRAKQIYFGKTGVPEPFDVLFSCTVPDCDIAEKKIHETLKSYRHNKRREFFRLPFEVARKNVINICEELFGKAKVATLHDIRNNKNTHEQDHELDEKNMNTVKVKDLTPSPIGTSILSNSQKQRISIFRDVLSIVYPRSINDSLDDFSRDKNPENEIEIWEHLAKAFMKIQTNEFISDEFKSEAYVLLLKRTFNSKTNVLKNTNLKNITENQAKSILNAYELKPKPILIKRQNYR